MNPDKFLYQQRQRRRHRVRGTLRGTTERPRLSVHRSNKHIYCQVIDDSCGKTLASASSRDKDLRSGLGYGGSCDAATIIGKAIAERALAAGVKQVRFDRGSYKFHGRVKAIAEAAREAGLSL